MLPYGGQPQSEKKADKPKYFYTTKGQLVDLKCTLSLQTNTKL